MLYLLLLEIKQGHYIQIVVNLPIILHLRWLSEWNNIKRLRDGLVNWQPPNNHMPQHMGGGRQFGIRRVQQYIYIYIHIYKYMYIYICIYIYISS